MTTIAGMAANTRKQTFRVRTALADFCRVLASLKLAVVLLVVLAAVLAAATFIEAGQGRGYVRWYVYGGHWFIALWALLGLNILAATWVRFPWRWKHLGFLTAHAGVLALLAGSIQTLVGGVEGRLSLVEGEAADSILLPHRSRLRVGGHGPNGQLSTEFSFLPGPVDWGTDNPLDFGRSGGLGLKVLEFYHHARPEVDWVPDESGRGGPAVKLAWGGSRGRPTEPIWSVANPFGRSAPEGEPGCQLQQAPVESMREDFLEPPSGEPGQQGILSAHYQGQRYPIAVDGNLGKEVPVGESGLSVTIVAYYANAVAEGRGRFTSLGAEPKNPMLQLQVHRPQSQEPIREIAYARSPLVNYELMRGKTCPIKFWYHHPAVAAPPGIELLQTPDQRLYCRVGVHGKYEPQGEVNVGDRIQVSPDRVVSILSYLPHARQEVTYHPLGLAEGETERLEAAALVALSVGGKTHNVWLGRNHPVHGLRTVQTAHGTLRMTFGYDRYPLGFSVKLLDFKRGMNPGRMGDASFASEVQVADQAQGLQLRREISMNRPLVYGKFTFYQSGFDQLPSQAERSVLTVTHDPGRFLKYLGSVMVCVGVFLTFYLRRAVRRKTSVAALGSETAEGQAGRQQTGPATRSPSCVG